MLGRTGNQLGLHPAYGLGVTLERRRLRSTERVPRGEDDETAHCRHQVKYVRCISLGSPPYPK